MIRVAAGLRVLVTVVKVYDARKPVDKIVTLEESRVKLRKLGTVVDAQQAKGGSDHNTSLCLLSRLLELVMRLSGTCRGVPPTFTDRNASLIMSTTIYDCLDAAQVRVACCIVHLRASAPHSSFAFGPPSRLIAHVKAPMAIAIGGGAYSPIAPYSDGATS